MRPTTRCPNSGDRGRDRPRRRRRRCPRRADGRNRRDRRPTRRPSRNGRQCWRQTRIGSSRSDADGGETMGVIANKVRSFAEQTKPISPKIETAVEAVREDAAATVETTEETVSRVETGTDRVRETVDSLEEIHESARETASGMEIVAARATNRPAVSRRPRNARGAFGVGRQGRERRGVGCGGEPTTDNQPQRGPRVGRALDRRRARFRVAGLRGDSADPTADTDCGRRCTKTRPGRHLYDSRRSDARTRRHPEPRGRDAAGDFLEDVAPSRDRRRRDSQDAAGNVIADRAGRKRSRWSDTTTS